MFELKFVLIFSENNERLMNLSRKFLRNEFPNTDVVINPTHIADLTAITCSVYLRHPSWPEFISIFRKIKRLFKEYGIEILQVIIGSESPSFQLMRNLHGIWVPIHYAYDDRELYHCLQEVGADLIEQEWFFLPFETRDWDSEYEITEPDENLQRFGLRINGTTKRVSVPIGLRVRMVEGFRISDYMTAAFGNSLESMPSLGGTNALLTTLLQMNGKLSLVNHYSEKIQRPEELDFYSMAAMNMSLVDDRDETNIANLVSSGKLIIEEVKLGG